MLPKREFLVESNSLEVLPNPATSLAPELTTEHSKAGSFPTLAVALPAAGVVALLAGLLLGWCLARKRQPGNGEGSASEIPDVKEGTQDVELGVISHESGGFVVAPLGVDAIPIDRQVEPDEGAGE